MAKAAIVTEKGIVESALRGKFEDTICLRACLNKLSGSGKLPDSSL